MFVNCVRHQRVRTHIVLIPKRRVGKRRIVRGRVDGYVAGANDAPAAFRLHTAKARTHPRHGIGHAARVRHRVKAVGSGHRPDAYRLKKSIESWITRHTHLASSRKTKYIENSAFDHLFIDRSTVSPVEKRPTSSSSS